MTRTLRTSLLSCAATLLAVVLAVPGIAAAAPAEPTLEGAGLVAGSAVDFVYTVRDSADLTGVQFHTHQDAALPADATTVAGVTLDGQPLSAPDGTAALDGSDLVVTLTTLPAGAHTIRFDTPIHSTATTTTSSSATLTAAGGVTVTSQRVDVAVNSVDLALTYDDPDFSQQFEYAGLGFEGDETYDVTNQGSAPVEAQFVLDAPAGIEPAADGGVGTLDSDGNVTPIDCVAGATPNELVCPLGTVTPGRAVVVDADLVVTAAGRPGSTGTFSASVQPVTGQPADTDTSNNSLSYSVLFTGAAHLTITSSASATTVPVGGRVTVTVSIHNSGPQNALYLTGLGGTYPVDESARKGSGLKVIAFDGATTPPADYPDVQRARVHTAQRQLARRHESDPQDPSDLGAGVVWFPGSLRPGQTATAHVRLEATRIGKSGFALLALSAAGDPDCDQDLFADTFSSCFGTQQVLTVTAKAVATHPAPTPTPAGSGSSLANTGSSADVPLTGVGLLLLMVGAGLMRAGRRRTVR